MVGVWIRADIALHLQDTILGNAVRVCVRECVWICVRLCGGD